MEDKTRYVLYVIILGSALGLLASSLKEAIGGNRAPIATFFLVCICVFLILFNYERTKTLRQIEESLIKRVRDAWVVDLDNFQKGTPDGLLFPVGFSFRPGAVSSPQSLEDLRGESEVSEANLSGALKRARGKLLVLGEAGSGKTVALLRLTRELIERAEKDPIAPIPVFLSLSTWREEEPVEPLELWLVRELRSRYDVAEELARTWILGKRLLYLFDDLNQNSPEICRRMNEFLEDLGSQGTVIAAQKWECESKIAHHGAIHLESLSEDFARETLKRLGSEYAADDQVVEIARSPLMLRVVSLAPLKVFENLKNSPAPTSEEVIKGHVARQLGLARKMKSPYPVTELKSWLSWLAQGSQTLPHTNFAIEELQPDWLRNDRQRYVYVITSRIAGALTIMSLGVGLMYLSQKMGSLVGSDSYRVNFVEVQDNLLWWLLVTVGLGGLTTIALDCLRLFAWPAIARSSSDKWRSIARSSRGLLKGPVWSNLIIYFSVFYFSSRIFEDPTTAVHGAAAYAVAFAFTYWNRDRERTLDSDIGTAHKLVWAGERIPHGVHWGLVGGYLAGLAYVTYEVTRELSADLILAGPAGLAFTLGLAFSKPKPPDPLGPDRIMSSRFEAGLSCATVVGIGTALVIWGLHLSQPDRILFNVQDLTHGLTSLWLFCLLGCMIGLIVRAVKKVSIVETRTPHQGLKTSLRTTVLLWLSVGVPAVLLLWGYSARVMGKVGTFRESLFFGMLFGLLFGFSYGGLDLIYRFVLRLILWFRGEAPLLMYATALDDAANLGLLRKIGHGYVFYHDSVRDDFVGGSKKNSQSSRKPSVDSKHKDPA